MEKGILRIVLEAAKSIKAGEAGEYREEVRNGITIRRYDYEGFALIVRAPYTTIRLDLGEISRFSQPFNTRLPGKCGLLNKLLFSANDRCLGSNSC